MSEYLKDNETITVPVTGKPVSIWSGELKNIIYAISAQRSDFVCRNLQNKP